MDTLVSMLKQRACLCLPNSEEKMKTTPAGSCLLLESGGAIPRHGLTIATVSSDHVGFGDSFMTACYCHQINLSMWHQLEI